IVWYVIGIATMILTFNFPLGVTCLLLAKVMPRKTLKGATTKVHIMGLKKFLTSQERQLEFQEKNWYLFEKLLPYAVALGVTETWASRFADLKEIPKVSWYQGVNLINSANFANSLNSFGSSVASAATPTSSSSGFRSGFSGGGFSGGGFGGGGGRSW
ncbi:DUF2207 domain-containing protein, partial [candidate division WWE3 bacterium]|nr:DUF2207 domain-containing protein [candidate division WWE3 bacterium]